MRWRCIGIGWLLAIGACAQAPDTLPMQLVQRHILVQASVNGAAPVWFLFDTGAGGIFLDDTYAQQQGILPEGQVAIHGSIGSSFATYADAQQLRLGPVGLDSVTLHLGPMGHIARVLGTSVVGIIGYDLLRRYAVEVHPARGHLLLHSFDRIPDVPPDAWLPIRRLPNNLIVTEATIYLADLRFQLPLIVDTGANRHLTIDQWAVDSLNLLARNLAYRLGPRGRGITSHRTRMVLATADSVDIPPLRFLQLPIALGAGTAGGAMTRQSAGTIGQGLLLGFRIIYDYQRQRMAWLPRD